MHFGTKEYVEIVTKKKKMRFVTKQQRAKHHANGNALRSLMPIKKKIPIQSSAPKFEYRIDGGNVAHINLTWGIIWSKKKGNYPGSKLGYTQTDPVKEKVHRHNKKKDWDFAFYQL